MIIHMKHWIYLIAAGVSEVVWALGLKYTDGFTKLKPSVITVTFMIVSFYCLAYATRAIPISIAYTIWVGIGAVGAFIGGIYLFDEKVNYGQLLFFVIVIIGIIGLKFSSIRIN